MKEKERRRVEERGAGGVARDRRANAEPDRRAFIVGSFSEGSQHQFRPFCLAERKSATQSPRVTTEGMKFGRKDSVESEVWSRRNEEQCDFRDFVDIVGVKGPGHRGKTGS